MPPSRRDFLELTSLTATGLLLKDLSSPPPAPTGRQTFRFDHDWQFFRAAEDSTGGAAPAAPPPAASWEPVTLPHSVRLEGRDASGGNNFRGQCWYRKEFTVPPASKDRIVYLTFGAAMQVADVWLNDTHLTTHYGGYLPFTLDLTAALRPDRPNRLLVRLDNTDNPEVPPGKPQKALDFTYFGGLYRSVELNVLHPLHITDSILAAKPAGGGIFVTFPEVSAAWATVRVQTDVANETSTPRTCTVTHTLTGKAGTVAATGSARETIPAHTSLPIVAELKVGAPHLWHPHDPHLYTLQTTIADSATITDTQSTRIGIRSIHFSKDQGLLINGERFFSVGANRHQDHPYVGYALPASAHYRDAFKLRDAGFTSWRSHYPQDPSFMDACDELGILSIVSNPGWQFMGNDVFKDRACENAREIIRRDRNRPSVILWEVQMNESDNRPIAARLQGIVHEEFPGPGVYTSGDPLRGPVPNFDGWDLEYASGGRGPQKEPTKPTWIREWGDQVDNWSDQQGRVRVSRSWGETPMLVQAGSHLRALDNIYAGPQRIGGADLWAGIDAYRGYHHQPFLGAPLDLFRLPKFDFYMFQSQRPAALQPQPIGSGPMVFIANFASFHSPAIVTVFSNCEQVRLLQNGKEVATQSPDAGYKVPHPPFSFKAADFSATRSMLFSNGIAPNGTEIGELKAEGLIAGKVVATHLIHSPGEPKSIKLVLDTCGRDPIADGSDWVRIYAHVCDARGSTYPYADDFVAFSVTGNATLIGTEKILANPVRAEAGIATNLIGMTRTPGPITVQATAPGLTPATLQFTSKPDPTPTC